MRNFRQFDIWKSGMNLVEEIYNLVELFPKNEVYGITSQICRAAVSIPSNIAEGASRNSDLEFKRYLEISMGSAFEVETLLEISLRRNYLSQQKYDELKSDLTLLEKQLNTFISKLNPKK